MLEFYGNYDIATPDPYIYIYIKNEIENSNTKLSELNDYSSIYTEDNIYNDETHKFDHYTTYLFNKKFSKINDDSTYFITTIKPNDHIINSAFSYLFNKDSTHLHITYLNLWTTYTDSINSKAYFWGCNNEGSSRY